MRNLTTNIEELKEVKGRFKTEFEKKDAFVEGTEFRAYPNLFVNLGKLELPLQTKSAEPTTSQQEIFADKGYQLESVIIKPVNPADYYKEELILHADIKKEEQIIIPAPGQVYGKVVIRPLKLQEKIADKNGPVVADAGFDGLSSVLVQVDIDDLDYVRIEKEITENGVYYPSGDNADAFTKVTVDIKNKVSYDQAESTLVISKFEEYDNGTLVLGEEL